MTKRVSRVPSSVRELFIEHEEWHTLQAIPAKQWILKLRNLTHTSLDGENDKS